MSNPAATDEPKEGEVTVVKQVSQFMDYTTAHGLGRLHAAMGVRKIIWGVFLIATYIAFTVHFSTLIARYLEKPLITTYDPKLPFKFPDVILCPLNRVSMSRILVPLNQEELDFLSQTYKFERDPTFALFESYTATNTKLRNLLQLHIWNKNMTMSEDFTRFTTTTESVEHKLLELLMPSWKNITSDTGLCYKIEDGGEHSYRGNVSTTVTVRKCQAWNSNTPHVPTPGYDIYNHSFCRNPKKAAPAPWCYTTDVYRRWDYCALPVCEDSFNTENCFSPGTIGIFYNGTQSKTVSGRTCQNWSSNTPHSHSYGSLGWNHNYCRNPSNYSRGVWCYTTDPSHRFEQCYVHQCPVYKDGECLRREDNGRFSYTGTRTSTVSGRTCQPWKAETPHKPFAQFSIYDHNLCRNPTGDISVPWCYTLDPKIRWEPCALVHCPKKQISNIASIIHDNIGDILFKHLGSDIFLNLIKCSVNDIECNKEDFTTFLHPTLGTCHKFNRERFSKIEKIADDDLKLDLEIFLDSTDIKGQTFNTPKEVSLKMSMTAETEVQTEISDGLKLFLKPEGEFPHSVVEPKNVGIYIPSGMHTQLHAQLNQDEAFPASGCLVGSHEVVYALKTWKSVLRAQYANSNSSEVVQTPTTVGDSIPIIQFWNSSTYKSKAVPEWLSELNNLRLFFENETQATYKPIKYVETESDCVNQRIVQSYLNHCDCLPSFLPIPVDLMQKHLFCLAGPIDVKNRLECFNNHTRNLHATIISATNICKERCKIPTYDITRTSSPWPNEMLQASRDSLLSVLTSMGYPDHFSKWRGPTGILYGYSLAQYLIQKFEEGRNESISSVRQRQEIFARVKEGLKSNLLKLSIKARHAYGDRTYREEAYPIKNLFADFGGLLGLYSGISILTACELMELIFFIVQAIKARRRGKKDEEPDPNPDPVSLKEIKFNGSA